jgi:eukaryotic-like serine/threonine-protein kinase
MIETLGRYKILSTIGQGAMGVVYKAVDPMIDRTVAIKTVNLSLNKDELAEYELRFQQEIKAAGRLNHPNIVTIYDVGRTDDVAYMAMEFLEGLELKDILAESGRPSVESSVEWIAQVAMGLGFAHENDIVHRDVKPSNIMIVRGGLAKITDFGIARMPASAVKTMTGLILGSPRYMSPEQVIGRNLDHRTDIFSLGVVLYELLTGVPPFDGDNVNAIMYATVNIQPPAPSGPNPGVPAMLDLIVAKALAKATEERYQSMREFADDLHQVKKLLLSKQPTGKVLAKQAPPSAKALSLDALGVGRYQKNDEAEVEAKPLRLAKGFDSFDATLKLAAMTNQIGEFSDYISETQKMRAYKGKIDGPLSSSTGAASATSGVRRSAEASLLENNTTLTNAQMHDAELARKANGNQPAAANNLLPLVIIVLLSVLAAGLAIALFIR